MSRVGRRVVAAVVVTVIVAVGWGAPASAATAHRRFATAEEAAGALVAALRSGDQKALLAILGDEGRNLVSSGDPVADRQRRDRFVAEYDAQHKLEAGGGKIVLVVGRNDFPFPIPIVPDGGAYDYMAHGRMLGGFALVAYPAQYGVSGVMTFIVNHDGVVYQKDLGPRTAAIALSMKEFNPDSTWKKI